MECSYDFWFHTNSTWNLKGKNNKYGKHLIQNNVFIQRPVDFGGWKGPSLMWSSASARSCMCVYVRVQVVVCLHWACETRQENLHTLGPGTVGEEEEESSNTLSGF